RRGQPGPDPRRRSRRGEGRGAGGAGAAGGGGGAGGPRVKPSGAGTEAARSAECRDRGRRDRGGAVRRGSRSRAAGPRRRGPTSVAIAGGGTRRPVRAVAGGRLAATGSCPHRQRPGLSWVAVKAPAT